MHKFREVGHVFGFHGDCGIQVKRKDGGYIDVPYVEGAVLVNLGALMEMWTGDKYPATVSTLS